RAGGQDVDEVEATTLLMGVQFVHDIGLDAVIFESDCSTIIRDLKADENNIVVLG
ncbi:hypothetical protein L195_g062891, partial [Trifolium pratense]